MYKKVIGFICALAFVALACSIGGGGGSDVLFQDDFSNENTGWEVGDYDTGSVGYGDGYYVVTSLQSGEIMWGLASQNFQDVVIEVDASQFQGPENNNNAYGVGCRFTSSDQPDGYLFRISGDGYYAIHKVSGGETTELLDWTSADDIQQGNATNSIRARCNGSSLSLEVNGKNLATVNDSTFTSGDIVLAATTYEDAMTEIHFDNLVVKKP